MRRHGDPAVSSGLHPQESWRTRTAKPPSPRATQPSPALRRRPQPRLRCQNVVDRASSSSRCGVRSRHRRQAQSATAFSADVTWPLIDTGRVFREHCAPRPHVGWGLRGCYREIASPPAVHDGPGRTGSPQRRTRGRELLEFRRGLASRSVDGAEARLHDCDLEIGRPDPRTREEGVGNQLRRRLPRWVHPQACRHALGAHRAREVAGVNDA